MRITSSGARSPAWKSTEWPIEPWLTRVTTKRVADPSVQGRAGHRAVEGPALLPHAGRHLELDLLDRQRHRVGASALERGQRRGHGREPGIRRAVQGRRARHRRMPSPRPRPSTAPSRRRSPPATGRRVTTTSSDHPHLPVADDAAPALGARADHADVEGRRATGHHPPGLDAVAEGEVVRRAVVAVDQVDDEPVAVGDGERGGQVRHVVGLDPHPRGVPRGLHRGPAAATPADVPDGAVVMPAAAGSAATPSVTTRARLATPVSTWAPDRARHPLRGDRCGPHPPLVGVGHRGQQRPAGRDGGPDRPDQQGEEGDERTEHEHRHGHPHRARRRQQADEQPEVDHGDPPERAAVEPGRRGPHHRRARRRAPTGSGGTARRRAAGTRSRPRPPRPPRP